MEHGSTPSWDDLRVLLHVSRAGSFQSAARALGVSTSTVARRVEALEQALGYHVVLRSASGTEITPEARQLVNTAADMEHALAASLRDSHTRGHLTGTVRLSVGEGFALGVTQALAGLRAEHPALCFELSVEARPCDIARREADVGLRTMRSSSLVLVERAVGLLTCALYASRSYIERRLPTARLSDQHLGEHALLGYDGPLAQLPQARWLTERGGAERVFASNSDQALIEAARQGMGLAVLPDTLVRDMPDLVRVSADSAPPDIEVFAVHHIDLRKDARIRAVIEALSQAFAARGLSAAR